MKAHAGTLGKMVRRKFGKIDFDCNQIAICCNYGTRDNKRRESYSSAFKHYLIINSRCYLVFFTRFIISKIESLAFLTSNSILGCLFWYTTNIS